MSSSSLIGRKLGQYEITALIGRGGMATVYKGYQASVDRYVAIKVLPPHPGLDDMFIRRFRLEAKTIGGLQHPHILPLYDYGDTEDHILYLVMAYIDGGSLDDIIDAGPMPPKRVEKILREVASALDYAHRRGVIHRDIKPANILLDSEGHAVLADFGIVKMTSSSSSSSNLTGTSVVGTPAYMAPEQCQGLNVDGRADIYSLGCVVYEMLTGRQPYSADTPMQLMLKHISEPPKSILDERPDLPPEVDLVMQKVLAKNPDDRYQTAVEFAEDFSKALHGESDSLAAVRGQYPLERDKTISQPLGPDPTQHVAAQNPSQPTIIMRESTSPLVLLGGFGIIGLVIVIVAVLLIGQLNNNAIVTLNTPAPPNAEPSAPTPTSEPNFGGLRFNSANQPGDTVNLSARGLAQPPQGQMYTAWLVNDQTGDSLALGQLLVDPFGDGVLVKTDDQGRLLPTFFNTVIITTETSIGSAPSDAVRYRGTNPPELLSSLASILVADPEGLNGGSLLDGALTEAGFASQHAGLAARASNVGGMQTHAEHTINILNGTETDYNGNGRGENPGRKVGLYFFVERIETQLTAIANAPTASRELQVNIETVRVCTQNVRDWADQVQSLEQELLAADSIEAVADQAALSTQLMDAIINGLDANDNGTIEPFEGECGLAQISLYGLQIANMPLLAVAGED